MDVIDALVSHHAILRQLYQQSETNPDVFDQFLRNLVVHHTMEEKYFYDLLEGFAQARRDALEAVNEHHIIELIIKDSERFPRDHERFSIKIVGLGNTRPTIWMRRKPRFGFLLMDLTFYWWHRANHVYPILWRFHNVHHIDPDMDVTTSFRFHFAETFYSTAFRLVQVGLTGVAPITYLVYEVVFNLGTLFHHSNLRLPFPVERLLNKVIVTPRMHGLHHSAVGGETNSNYSVVFRWWDALHRTLRLNVPQSQVVIGVPGYLRPEENRIVNLLALPFARQRPYWHWPSGKASVRKPGEVADPRVMLE